MSEASKCESKKETVTKCKEHHYVITGWTKKGPYENATQMRCAKCLLPVSLEELASKEWKDAQGL